MSSTAGRSFGPITPAAYLTLAIELGETQNAAWQRSAVDRAYYAAFLTTRDELTEKQYGLFTRGPRSHIQVFLALYHIRRDLGLMLRDLRRARNRLTYQTSRQALPQGLSLTALLESARSVIDAVKALPVAR